MRNITFNKMSVILMYVMVIGLPAVCIVLRDYPPNAFIYCWFGFWIVQAIITAKLRISKRKKQSEDDLLDYIGAYINEDNIADISEKFLGVELKPKKKGVRNEKVKK